MKPSSHTLQTATKVNSPLVKGSQIPLIPPLTKGGRGDSLVLKKIGTFRNNTHGVTLIEMLVALVITAIIVSSVYVAFNAGTKSWQVGDTMMQRYQNARGALDMMSREISAIYMVTQNIYKTGLIYDNSTSPHELRFVASIPGNTGSWGWDLCKIGYRYNVTDKEIERGFDTNPDLISTAISGWQPLVSNINSLDFKYYYWNGSNWDEKNEWDSTDPAKEYWELPKAVEITITVQDDKQIAKEREFKTVVYIPVTH